MMNKLLADTEGDGLDLFLVSVLCVTRSPQEAGAVGTLTRTLMPVCYGLNSPKVRKPGLQGAFWSSGTKERVCGGQQED